MSLSRYHKENSHSTIFDEWGRNPDIEAKNIFGMASTHAAAQSVEVVYWCYRIGGESTMWGAAKLQELHRDMSVLPQH